MVGFCGVSIGLCVSVVFVNEGVGCVVCVVLLVVLVSLSYLVFGLKLYYFIDFENVFV